MRFFFQTDSNSTRLNFVKLMNPIYFSRFNLSSIVFFSRKNAVFLLIEYSRNYEHTHRDPIRFLFSFRYAGRNYETVESSLTSGTCNHSVHNTPRCTSISNINRKHTYHFEALICNSKSNIIYDT